MSSSQEGTPFVIDFKQPNRSTTYGTAQINAVAVTPLDGPYRRQSGGTSNNNIAPYESKTATYCLHGHDRIEMRDHCHWSRSEGVDKKARRKLIIASVLCLVFMCAEILGGVLSNSLAIATDAAHLLTDFASFMISLFAIWIAGRPSTQRMSFGWYRAEVIGALASVVMIWFITAILVWLAIQRLITGDYEVDAVIMLITSGLAILVNLIMGVQLHHGHSHGGMTSSHGHSHGPSKTPKLKMPAKEAKPASGQTDLSPPPNLSTVESTPAAEPHSSSRPETSSGPGGDVLAARESESDNSIKIIRSSSTSSGFEDQNAPRLTMLSDAQDQRTAAAVNDNTKKSINDITPHYLQTIEPSREVVNMNVRAAFIHVIGDVIQSVGVFLAALLIYFRPDWEIADPICTFIFSVIVLFTTFNVMKDALLVLMEGTPSYMHYAEVFETFKQIEGVERVHNLRIWALSINKIALSVHLAIAPGANPKRILQEATTLVHLRYNFFETTIQIEDFTPQMDDCQQCTAPNPI